MEFFSICVGTDIPQLIALNKNNGDLYLLIEASNTWEKLDAKFHHPTKHVII